MRYGINQIPANTALELLLIVLWGQWQSQGYSPAADYLAYHDIAALFIYTFQESRSHIDKCTLYLSDGQKSCVLSLSWNTRVQDEHLICLSGSFVSFPDRQLIFGTRLSRGFAV